MFIFQLLIGIALNILAALLTPQPKAERQEVKELSVPTAEGGKPVPVVFGTVVITAPNFIEYVKQGHIEYKIKAKGGKK